MANNLKMDMVQRILALQRLGWSSRRMARELGIDRETVGRHLRVAAAAGELGTGSKPATNPPTGSEEPANLPGGLATGRAWPGGSSVGAEPAGNSPMGPVCLAGGPESVSEVRPSRSHGVVGSQPPAGGDIAGSLVAEDAAQPGSNRPGGPAGRTVAAASESTGGPDGVGGVRLPGSGGGDGVCRSGPASDCEPYRQIILARLEQGLTAQRIWQDLVSEHGFGSCYDSVKRFIRRLGKAAPLPFRRMECVPGEQGQIDFGRGAPIEDGPTRRRVSHVFRIVLGHSRKGYSEAVFRQTTDNFLLCLENAFWSLGGVPRTLVIDNLRAAVMKADWYEPELNPRVLAFCEHYGTVILPARPYMPRHKGKVERGIGYVRGNALKGRTFSSLAEENRHLAEWEATVADTRIHGTTRRQVVRVFREVERAALLALPAGRFPFFREARRTVHRDGHVEVDKAYYSVPPEYVGHQVWARWDGRVVRVFNQRMEQIAVHAQQESGRRSTRAEDIHSHKISAVERGAEYLLEKAGHIGAGAERWARAMLQARGVEGIRVLQGLVGLCRRHESKEINEACAIALTHEAFRLRDVRELIKRGGGGRQGSFEYLAEHEIIRDLADYGSIVAASLRGQSVEAMVLAEERDT